ncbi:RNA polymerase sigma factor [Tessaracoccus antarcticus]|uniref:RNA polymerase sigma factor n=1 Tax=Tessaracoccus antarcticus TaxID=2479848 RepID=A0A3M0GVE4_9ACTN|nr:RNA polymerase sigma factor [Tessaracoccus antarcticus]RMB61306.1 RNA polymerase sigma factor [Tessaracoccus antarcticus]
MEAQEEQVLWGEAIAGDGESFARIFDLHRDRVFRHVLRLVESVADAEDTVAIAFMELWRRRIDVRVVNGSVMPWLLVTATYVTRNVRRSSLRYREMLDRLPRSDVSRDAAQEFLGGSIDGLEPLLASELKSLGRQDQQMLSLVALEGYTMAETAEVLGISLAAVKSRMHRLRRRLHPKLSAQIGETTT